MRKVDVIDYSRGIIDMIISRTPLRIILAGGGTDLRPFYQREGGAGLAFTINKYVYIIANKRFYPSIKLAYSQIEVVDDINLIQHRLFREALKLVGITSGIEISAIADIPAGSGLGSSSSFTVGLLNTLYAYKGISRNASQLAEEACEIEIEILGEPIGKQDQYIAAFGGLRFFEFHPNGEVNIEEIQASPDTKRELEHNFLLFYTGKVRLPSEILSAQDAVMKKGDNYIYEMLRKTKDSAFKMRNALEKGQIDEVGYLLHTAWKLRQTQSDLYNDPFIDELYSITIREGALGGKVLGAAGGVLLIYCPPEKHRNVRNALAKLGLIEIDFMLEPYGSRFIV